MQKKSYVMYTDYIDHIQLLSMEQRGVLLTAIMQYNFTGEVIDMDGMVQMAFSFIRANLDRDAVKYEEEIQKRKDAGRKGGLAKASNAKQCLAKPSNAKQSLANVADNDTVTDTVTVTDTDKTHTTSPAGDSESLFDTFWKAYPKKVAKGNAEKAFRKIRPSKSLVQQMLDAVQKAKETYKWQEANGRYIPNPATWLNGRCWEDDIPADMGLPGLSPVKTKQNRFANFEQRPFDEDDEAMGTAWLKKYQGER